MNDAKSGAVGYSLGMNGREELMLNIVFRKDGRSCSSRHRIARSNGTIEIRTLGQLRRRYGTAIAGLF